MGLGCYEVKIVESVLRAIGGEGLRLSESIESLSIWSLFSSFCKE